uniref:Eukaryotic translation initiation factor 5 n=1 Tax=Oncorhynchus tshawytscha TaxID=74940 RepID=A0AAZ3P2K0_ONCTS
MSVNVNRSVLDQFYRYKMPRIIAKVEGKGNGIKTVIVNMTDVAKSLNRPPTYPTKFFGCELGAQTQFDAKNDRFIVNGSHEANKLQDMLDGFIPLSLVCAAMGDLFCSGACLGRACITSRCTDAFTRELQCCYR